MPELPDILAYITALEPRVVGNHLDRLRIASLFVLRSVDPPVSEINDRTVTGLRRIGKRIAFELEDERFVLVHLMVAGRFHWRGAGAKAGGRTSLAAFEFKDGTLLLTEASTKKRASIHLVRGEDTLREFDRGGLEVLGSDATAFRAALQRENHTLKRALTDPRLFSGIGNAYSDEILHRARLSPFKLTERLADEETDRLHFATLDVLHEWIERLGAEARTAFPEKVTAFRPEMAVHGKFGQPCPVCGEPVQRITYAENEANYCAECQTSGRLLADRGLSRLLRSDWPRTIAEMEERKDAARAVLAKNSGE